METIREFNTSNRCDRCGAQAYHAVNLDELELLFCNNHLRFHHDKLLVDGWSITTDVTGLERIGVPAPVV